MSQPPPWNPYGQQNPGQYQGQPQPGWPQQPQAAQPYQGQPPGGVPPLPGRGRRKSWPGRHPVLTGLGGAFGLVVIISVTAAAAGGTPKTVTEPGPTVTVTQPAPTVTVTKTVTKTKTVTPTANAQGESTQISADGVYVIGQDIPGGTWHTSGGQQCYEATLASTDTSNIIDNNNFTGPDTVSLAGAKAFDISGGCTWRHE